MTEDENLDKDDIIMDEFGMMEELEEGNFRDHLLINTSGHAGSTRTRMTPRMWQCSDTRLQHQEAAAEFKRELGQYFIVKQLENPWSGTQLYIQGNFYAGRKEQAQC